MRHRLAGLFAVVLSGAVAAAAQRPSAPESGRVRDLLVLIESAEQQGATDAATELERMGPSIAPALVEMLKTRAGCQAQWVASSVLGRLQLEGALVDATLLQIARGTCSTSSVRDVDLQQHAAFIVIERARGIALMAELLRGDDLPSRRRAAFAFDGLTERLAPAHPRAIAATPEILAATEAVLPLLRDVAVSKAPQQIRCLSYEAIDQARRLPYDAVRARATTLLDKVRVDCDSRAGFVESAGWTDKPRREGLEDIIARLDSQSPPLASRTSSVLLAAGDEVVPLLQKRLRHTDKCRGLALVAGILASRNVDDAGVEAAFVRVLGGKCEGREPFDLKLAQGVASAFMSRADGVVKVTAILGDRDLSVRRRGAEAFALLFERLGSGERAEPAAAVDPALVVSARAALAPLVTLATTERDRQARCQAVAALLRAQQSVHDALRADAAAATLGRTLRCVGPPTP
jgi:hypothetical protein